MHSVFKKLAQKSRPAEAGLRPQPVLTAPAKPNPVDQLPLGELIRRYDYMEDLCDRVISEQQAAINAHQQRVSEDNLKQMMRNEDGQADAVPVSMTKLAEIEELETEIRIYRYQLETLESVIYETEPTNMPEALAKLRFISRLVVDGVEFEADFFAFMIEECADIAEISANTMLSDERQKARRTAASAAPVLR
ncbi:hypothetical protein BFP70_12755 [Thioclava sp. SK-1]|uniref:hypothetical protein n=1 Tax=Thioclava sp. SK-1 TaxID=1889770 RepID=UPI000827099B|nr:hypothetical protein [Thioclava sp. SK-1]OCX63080.1 hypothetical protein BFP70_12755 [Thioclava sp. SK-1]